MRSSKFLFCCFSVIIKSSFFTDMKMSSERRPCPPMIDMPISARLTPILLPDIDSMRSSSHWDTCDSSRFLNTMVFRMPTISIEIYISSFSSLSPRNSLIIGSWKLSRAITMLSESYLERYGPTKLKVTSRRCYYSRKSQPKSISFSDWHEKWRNCDHGALECWSASCWIYRLTSLRLFWMRISESSFYRSSLKLTNTCWLYFITSIFSNSLESLLPFGLTTNTVSSTDYKEKGEEKSQPSSISIYSSLAATVIKHDSSLWCQYQSLRYPTWMKNCWSVLYCWKASGRVHLLTRMYRGAILSNEVKIWASSQRQFNELFITNSCSWYWLLSKIAWSPNSRVLIFFACDGSSSEKHNDGSSTSPSITYFEYDYGISLRRCPASNWELLKINKIWLVSFNRTESA